jgi:Capsule polysaccharide biosynthesis protein
MSSLNGSWPSRTARLYPGRDGLAFAPKMRVVFYSRPWSVDLHIAIEDHWRRLNGGATVSYITQHRQVENALGKAGRDVTSIIHELRRLDVEDPASTLESLEQRYGNALMPLMRYLMADRYFTRRTRAWQLEQLARFALFFEGLLDGLRPDVLVFDAPDSMPGWIGGDIARARGCGVVGLMPSTLPPGRLLMLSSHDTIQGSRERYERIRATGISQPEREAARALQSVVLGAGTRLDYLPRRELPDLLRRLARGSVIKEHASHSLWQWRERASGNWYTQPDAFIWHIRRLTHRARAMVADQLYLRRPQVPERFVFYPLHFEPEAATLVHGSYFENQMEVVRNLARSLPIGWRLVVKEHFYMRGRRPLSFYRSLRRIPNVQAVPFSVPTNALIRDARVVAVIASTVGLEASLIGKPVVMFGDYPWDYAPTVHKVAALSKLPALLRSAETSVVGPDHPDVLAFAASWDAALPVGRYYRTRQYDWREPDNVRNIASAIEAVATRGRGLDDPLHVSTPA